MHIYKDHCNPPAENPNSPSWGSDLLSLYSSEVAWSEQLYGCSQVKTHCSQHSETSRTCGKARMCVELRRQWTLQSWS